MHWIVHVVTVLNTSPPVTHFWPATMASLGTVKSSPVIITIRVPTPPYSVHALMLSVACSRCSGDACPSCLFTMMPLTLCLLGDFFRGGCVHQHMGLKGGLST